MKKTKLLLLTVTGLISAAYAQQNSTARKYGAVVNAELAKKHLSILASDAFEGRETGQPGADKAAHYIADEFKSLGLKPIVNGSYFFDVPVLSHGIRTTFVINGKTAVSWDDFYAVNAAGKRSLTVDNIVYVGYGTEPEIANADIAGKIILWVSGPKPTADKTAALASGPNSPTALVLKNLRSKNPAIILVAGQDIDGILKRFKGKVSQDGMMVKKDITDPNPAPQGYFWITTELASRLVQSTGKTFDELKAASANNNAPAQIIKSDVQLEYHTDYKDVKAADVLGYLPGSDPKLKNEVLVISAHYDHIGISADVTKKDRINNGADDDGSGTTAILELARAFSKAKKDGHGPKRSILFLANVGEEKGLLGSEYYTDHPVIPLTNTITDLNIDMIGRVGKEYIGKPDSLNYVYVIGSGMLSTDLHNVNEKANKTYTKLNLDYKYDDLNDPNHFYERSDHYNFAKHGVPIIFFFNGEHEDYHEPGDEVSKINFPLLAKRAQLVFYTAWDLANANKRPVVDAKK